MLLVVRLLLLFTIIRHLQSVSTQYVPPIACPQYFQYLSYGNQYIGKVTLPNLLMGTTKVDVEFSQRVPVQSNYYGRLSLFEDQQTTINNLQNGKPISYRVDFPVVNELPKLTRISVNNVDICYASDYPGPSTMLKLQHTLHTHTSNLANNVNPFNNFDFEINNRENFGQTTMQQPSVNFAQNPSYTFTNNPFLQSQAPVRPPIRAQPTSTPMVIENRPLDVPSSGSMSAISQDINTVCGQEGSGVSPLIHGGTVLTRGQYPWLTAVYQKKTEGLKFICGGSLVSSRVVVTAAHCFKLISLTAEQIVVYLGRHNLENYSEQGVVSRDIKTLLIHPEYNSNLFPDADIAILQMQTSVTFSQYIRPICLWNESDDASLIVGQTGVVAGWGADEKDNEVSALPKMVDTNIVSESDCLRSLEIYKALTSPRTLCAGNRDGTGPCMGDSGGGLMLNRQGRWVLRGIVSAGQTIQKRCNLREFVVYCDLAKHITWVRSNMLT